MKKAAQMVCWLPESQERHGQIGEGQEVAELLGRTC
jgi:hypothetical protein